jgi:hypothetical protein
MKKSFLFVLAVFILVLCAQGASAQFLGGPPEGPWEKIGVSAGGFLAALDSSVRLGVTEATGIDVDLEGALGVDSGLFVFRADGLWRFSRNLRHRFDLSYIGYFRTATRTIQEDIEISDDLILSAGDVVDTKYNIQIFKFLYSWSLYQDDRVDLGIGGGLFIMPISISINDRSDNEEKAQDITAPLPVLDLRADFAITPKFYYRQKIDLFFLRVGDFQGSIIDTTLTLEYRIWRRLGVGFGYESFRLRVQAQGSGSGILQPNGKIQTEYNGLLFYAKFYY